MGYEAVLAMPQQTRLPTPFVSISFNMLPLDAIMPRSGNDCFLEDGELEIDNGATVRANHPIAIGRGNCTCFGSINGGKTCSRGSRSTRLLDPASCCPRIGT
jgi:hypothetical protein